MGRPLHYAKYRNKGPVLTLFLVKVLEHFDTSFVSAVSSSTICSLNRLLRWQLCPGFVFAAAVGVGFDRLDASFGVAHSDAQIFRQKDPNPPTTSSYHDWLTAFLHPQSLVEFLQRIWG